MKKINSGNFVVIYHKLASSNCNLVESIKKRTKAKVIVINHTLYQSHQWNKFKKLDRMVAVSSHMKKKMSKWYPNMNISCIRNGVSMDRYEKIKASKSNKKGIFLTGRINRICGWKYSPDWGKWCRDVKLPVKMMHEYIGGRMGGGRGRTKVVGKGRNIVNMMGPISNFKSRISIMKNWDIFLYEINRNEGIRVSILEALACGIPVLCSNHFGNIEIIEPGINGYIFKNRNQAQSILKDLISNPKKLKELKKSTKQYFKDNLDAKYMADEYIEIIREVTGEKKPKKAVISEVIEEKVVVEKKKDKDKFSIITSSYNKAKNLREWANSILKQEYRPLEVIIADDCSVDDTKEIIVELKKEFKNKGIEFQFINNPEKLYCGGSYYNLVDYISGSYVGVLDADDMLEDGAVEYIMNLYKKYPDVAWIYTQFLWCNEQMKNGRKGLNSAPGKRESLLDLGQKGIHGIGSGWRTFSYKIERPDKLFGKYLTCAVDKNMGYRLEEAGVGLFTKRKCYKHRGHPVGSKDSVSSTKHAMKMWKQVIKEAINRRKKYNKKIYPIISID